MFWDLAEEDAEGGSGEGDDEGDDEPDWTPPEVDAYSSTVVLVH